MKPERLRAFSIENHLSGDIAKAEKGYKEFISRGISDPDILSNYGLICQETGRTEKAKSLYEKCISYELIFHPYPSQVLDLIL